MVAFFLEDNTVFVTALIVLFFIMSGGGYLFWKIRSPGRYDKDKVILNDTSRDWEEDVCKPLNGKCGKGSMRVRKLCHGKDCPEGKNEEKTISCYVECAKPYEVVDWGHPNDLSTLPIGGPRKGWYDFTGQGVPNDYCRWVGDAENPFWSCQTDEDTHVKADPYHITFSGGPSNRAVPVNLSDIERKCPLHTHLQKATDPELLKSIANGFIADCTSRCVYDYKNPKTGWVYKDGFWLRVDDMEKHKCGKLFKDELKSAMKNYENLFKVRNAWTI